MQGLRGRALLQDLVDARALEKVIRGATLDGEHEPELNRTRCPRLIRQWILLGLWCGLVPLVLTTTYYEARKPTDFDPPLNLLRDKALKGSPFWAARVGSRSYYRANVGTRATWFGVNVEDSDLQRAERVGNGQLLASSQATYLVRGGNSMLPTVVTIFRDVSTEGKISYSTETRGRKPILFYIAYVSLGSAGIVVFLNVAGAISRRIKMRLRSSRPHRLKAND